MPDLLRRREDRLPPQWAALLALAAVYAASVVLGRATRLDGTQLALVWPGAAVAFLWLSYAWTRGWLAVHLAALFATTVLLNTATDAPLGISLAFGLANCLHGVCTVAVLRWWQSGAARLRCPRDLAALVCAAVAGSAASGALVLLAIWLTADVDLLHTAEVWLLRNSSSTVVLSAVALRLADRHHPVLRPGAARRAELLLIAGLVVVGYVVVFGSVHPSALGFALLPLSMWVALRCSTTLASVHVLLVGVLVVMLTAAGRGPFATQEVVERVLLAQAFVIVVGLVALTLALSADERAGLVAGLLEERHRSAAQAAMLETVLDTVDVAIVACDAQAHITLMNRTARAFHGGPGDEDVDASQWPARYDLFGPDGTTRLEPDEVPLLQALREGRVSEALITIAPSGGVARTVRCEGRTMLDVDGTLLGAVVVQTDVTALRASEQQFRSAFEDGPTPMARLTPDGVVEHTNAAMRRFLSLPSRRLVGVELAGLAASEDRDRLAAAVRGRGAAEAVEVRLERADGSALWCEVTSTVVDLPGTAAHVLVQVLDVHARKLHELALEDVAHRDTLTGLGNRKVLEHRLEEMLQAGGDTAVVLAYLDLDGFKAVNDDHGHDAGDAVLRAVGTRLLGLSRADDLVVRVGGDEFVLAYAVRPRAAAERFAVELGARLEAAVSQVVEHAGQFLAVGVSVGTVIAAPGVDPTALLRQADRVMYQRKRARTSGRPPVAAPAPLPTDEDGRLRALGRLRVLDTPPDQALDQLVQAAALVADVPTALVSLVDEHRQWFKARCALEDQQTSRDVSFCAHVVALDDELHVEDARRDPRFADNPLVTGELAIRSYAGFPLRTSAGFVLGSLCVIGYAPGLLSEAQRRVLRVLAAHAMVLLDQRRLGAESLEELVVGALSHQG